MDRSLIIYLVLLLFFVMPIGGAISSVDAAKEIYNQTDIEPAGWVDSGTTTDIYGAVGIHYESTTTSRRIPIAIYFNPEMASALMVTNDTDEWPIYPLLHDVIFGPFTITSVGGSTTAGGEKISRMYHCYTAIVDIGGGYLQAIEMYPNPRIKDIAIGQKIKVAYNPPPQEWTEFISSAKTAY